MCEYLGKRERKPVVRPGYYEEEQIDQILMNQYGVTEEELEDDDAPSLSSRVFKEDNADICIPEKERITLCADGTSSNDVLQFLQNLSVDDVFKIWEIKDNRKAIGRLIRNPGGWHEWLMVAALPYLRAMGIPLTWIRDFRTRTSQCNFYYQDGRRRCEGIHGGSGSTKMHNDLFQCYAMVYQSYVDRKCASGQKARNLIARNLSNFAKSYYGTELKTADALDQLIIRLRS